MPKAKPLIARDYPVLTAQVGMPYAGFDVIASGGAAPYSFSVSPTGGQLPPGITINASTGHVGGTPTSPGTYSSIVFRVTDAHGKTANTSPFSIAVSPSSSLSISGTPVLVAQEGVAYAGFVVSASGGTPPYAYSVHAGTLPTGITLGASSGVVSGTPTSNGTFSGITIRATDAMAATADLTPFTLTVSTGSYPAAVISAGLQAVWDLRVGGPSTPGPRGATTKTLGIDSLPAGATFSGGFLIITQSATFANWNFDVGTCREIDVRGNSTVVTFNDCLFGPPTYSDPSVSAGNFYGINVSDNATTPTVNINYCKFDGKRYQSNIGVGGPWGGAAILVQAGASVNADHVWFIGVGYDVVKETNATYAQTWCLIQAYGWNQNADADGVQQISGTIDVENNLYDIRDGAAAALGAAFPGQAPNSGLFCTIDTPSTGDGHVTCKNNVFVGYGGYTLQAGFPNNSPYNVLSVADNHTATGNGFHIRSGDWENNVVEKGNQGWWTHGGTETSAVSIATWTGNRDFTGDTLISAPSF